jgi:localization factor PodJL
MEPLVAPEPVAPLTTGSIGPNAPTEPVTFDMPAEAVGPLELRQAAADGDARAQFEIAAIFTEGRAIEQDYAEAAKWYERAAAQGLAPAQYRLGNLYETGTGVEKNLENAKLWYQRAAEAGNRMAMHNLAALYAGGQLGEQEFESAAEWFQQAAARGMTDSQFNLGMLYARGLGLAQDFEQSYKWFSLAANNGDADAAKARDDIAKSLNADAVGRLSGEVAAWKAEPIDLAANFAPLGTWSAEFNPGEAITTRDVVAKVQQALTRLGFDVGTPDGLAGPKTMDAIKSFERSTGMSEVGTINPRLLAVLGSQPV